MCRSKQYFAVTRVNPSASCLAHTGRDTRNVAGIKIEQIDLEEWISGFAFALEHHASPVAAEIALPRSTSSERQLANAAQQFSFPRDTIARSFVRSSSVNVTIYFFFIAGLLAYVPGSQTRSTGDAAKASLPSQSSLFPVHNGDGIVAVVMCYCQVDLDNRCRLEKDCL